MDQISGIYKIQSTIKPERIYIGSAKDINVRWGCHLCDLKNNKHCNKKLQYHYNKYGIDDLVFSVIIECKVDNLISQEQYYIDSLETYFNICKIAGSNLGYRHRTGTKNKIRKSLLGKKHSKERIDKSKKSHRGVKRSLESRLKQGKTIKNRKRSEETKEKIRKALTGVKHSEERKRKSSESHMGQKSWNKGLKLIDGKYICQN